MQRVVLGTVAILGVAGVAFAYLSGAGEPIVELGDQGEVTVAPGHPGPFESVVYDEDGVPVGGVEPNPQGGAPLNIDNILANADEGMVVSIDERDTFTVPTPEDHVWEDYLQYRRTYRSSLDNSPGYSVAYDPEWRSLERGYRKDVPAPFLELYGGAETIDALIQDVVKYLGYDDTDMLVDLAIRKEEFQEICWPKMPQSRPYLRYTWEDAWGFQYANILGGIREAQRQRSDHQLVVESFGVGRVRDYEHFRLHDQILIHGVDERTGEKVELTFLDSVIERNGVYKVFLYKD